MYQTQYGFQGVGGIMADYGIQSFEDFSTESEIRDYFTVENCLMMFGPSDEIPRTQAELNVIADEFIAEWEIAPSAGMPGGFLLRQKRT